MNNDLRPPSQDTDLQPQNSGSAPARPVKHKATLGSLLDKFNPGYLVGGIGVMWRAITRVDAHIHDQYEENGRLSELKEAIKGGFREAYKDYQLNAKDLADIAAGAKIERNSPGTLRGIENDIFIKMQHKDGIKNLYDKYRRLKPHQKQNLWIDFATVFSFLAGFVFSQIRQLRLAHKLEHQIAQTEREKKAPITVPTENGTVDVSLEETKEILQKILAVEAAKKNRHPEAPAASHAEKLAKNDTQTAMVLGG